MGRILGAGGAARTVGAAVTGVAEVFVGNRAEREAAEHASFSASLGQFGAEFGQPAVGRFDGFVNGLNRLPRPLLALSTIGLFGYAMAEPNGFGLRMQGLALIPDPLWWLLGAIVSFYFGARELHYLRAGPVPSPAREAGAAPTRPAPTATPRAQVGAPPATLATTQERPAAYEDPRPAEAPEAAAPTAAPLAALASRTHAPGVAVRAADPHFNAALEEWRALRP